MKSNINGSKVVITGGSGYIGARLSMYLAKNNFQVIPVCRSRGNINENWMTLMQSVIFGDIRDEGTLDKVRKCLPDIIIHLISLDLDRLSPNLYIPSNVLAVVIFSLYCIPL